MPDDKLGYTVNRLVNDYGWSPQAAAGIAANIGHESAGFNVTADGDGGASFGLAQWNGGRRTALINYASENGRRADDLDTQLDFLHHELHTDYSDVADKLRRASSHEEATRIFSQGYEKPGKPMMQSRLSWAQKAMKAIGPSEAVASEDTIVEEPWPLKRKSSGTSVSSEEPWPIKGKNVGGEELWPIKKAGESTPTMGPDVESNTSEWESLKSTPSIIWNGAEAGFANRISQLAAAGTGMMGGGNARVFGYDMPEVSQKEAQEAVFKELIKNVKPPDNTYIGKILYGAGSALPDLLVMGLISPIAGVASSQVGNALLQKVIHSATTFGAMGALSAEPVKEALKGIVAGGVLGGIPGSWNLLSRVGSGAGIGVSLTALENQMEGKPQELKDLVAASVLMGFFAGLPQSSKQGMSKEEIAALNKMQTEVQARRKELFEQGIALPEEKLVASKVEYETDPAGLGYRSMPARLEKKAGVISTEELRTPIEVDTITGVSKGEISKPSTKASDKADAAEIEARRLAVSKGLEKEQAQEATEASKEVWPEDQKSKIVESEPIKKAEESAKVFQDEADRIQSPQGREELKGQLELEEMLFLEEQRKDIEAPTAKEAESSARVFAKEELEFEALLKSPRGKDALAAQLAAEEAVSLSLGQHRPNELGKPLQPWLLTPEQARQRLSMAADEQGTVKDPFPGTSLTANQVTKFNQGGLPDFVDNLRNFLKDESGTVSPGWEFQTLRKFTDHLRSEYGEEGKKLADWLSKGGAFTSESAALFKEFRDQQAEQEVLDMPKPEVQRMVQLRPYEEAQVGRISKALEGTVLGEMRQLVPALKESIASGQTDALEAAKMLIRSYSAGRRNELARVDLELKRFNKDFKWADNKEFLRLLKEDVSNYQSGKGVSPAIRGLLEKYDQLRKPYEEFMAEHSPGWKGKDHYFREMFKPPKEGWEKWFYSNKTSFDGPRGFLKESKYAMWADGLAKGLEPRKSNILDLIRTDLMEKDQFMKGHQLAGLFEEMGVLHRLPTGEILPQGMLPIRGAFGLLNYKDVKTGEMVVGGTYIADRNVANLISGQLEPGLMAAIDNSVANPALRLGAKVAAKGWIGSSNALRMIEVFGMHHAYATDNHVRAIIAGNIPWHVVTSVMGGTTDAVKAMAPGFSIALNKKVAKGLQDAWLTKKGSTEMQDGVFNIIQGGGNINAHPGKIVRGWMEGTAPEYGNALKDALIDISHDIKDLRIGSALKETAHGISAPIMSYLVPDAKVSVFHLVNKQPMDALRAKYEVTGIGKDARTRNPVDQKQFEVERLKLNQDHWKFVDYSFGQIPRENMMMRNTWKDLMNFAIQFPGWNIGTFKLMGYAASGTVKNLAIKPALYAPGIKGSKISQSQLLKSSQLENQAARMAMGLALTQGITGSLIHMALNGQWPENIKDMFMPLITKEDADKGIKEERAMLPGYLKSGLSMAYHPLSSVAGLQNHMITAMQELYANKRSYASSYIRTSGASMTQQTEEVAMDLASRFRPFFMSQQEKGQTWLGKYGSWVGLYPASKLIAAEPDERMLMEQGGKHQTIRTPAEEKVNKLKNNIIKEAKQGNKEEAKKLLREGLTEGTLDPDKVEKWKIETGLTQRQVRFKNVPLEMMLQVYDKASESHRKEYVSFLVKKLSNATPKELKDYKKDILRFKDDIKLAIVEGALDE